MAEILGQAPLVQPLQLGEHAAVLGCQILVGQALRLPFHLGQQHGRICGDFQVVELRLQPLEIHEQLLAGQAYKVAASIGD